MLALVLALAISAPAQSLLDQAEKQVEEADFSGAETTLQEALAQPDNDDAALIAIYGQMALVFLYQARTEEARNAFERVLYLKPDWTPPEGGSPKVRELFAEVLERFKASATPIAVVHTPLEGSMAGKPLLVAVVIKGMRPQARAMLHFRPKLSPAWSSVDFLREEGEAFTAIIPGPALEPGDLDFDYYIEVQDAQGTRLHGAGSAQEPLGFHVAAPPPPPKQELWYNQWWVWATAGTAVVGIAAAVIVPAALAEPNGALVIQVRIE